MKRCVNNAKEVARATRKKKGKELIDNESSTAIDESKYEMASRVARVQAHKHQRDNGIVDGLRRK